MTDRGGTAALLSFVMSERVSGVAGHFGFRCLCLAHRKRLQVFELAVGKTRSYQRFAIDDGYVCGCDTDSLSCGCNVELRYFTVFAAYCCYSTQLFANPSATADFRGRRMRGSATACFSRRRTWLDLIAAHSIQT